MNISVFLSANDIKISDGALYAVIGFVIVLAVLALLVGIFYLTGFLFQTKALSKDKPFERKKKQSVQSASDTSDADLADEELLAVITAAVSAVYDSESDGDGAKPEFVIKRVKRK